MKHSPVTKLQAAVQRKERWAIREMSQTLFEDLSSAIPDHLQLRSHDTPIEDFLMEDIDHHVDLAMKTFDWSQNYQSILVQVLFSFALYVQKRHNDPRRGKDTEALIEFIRHAPQAGRLTMLEAMQQLRGNHPDQALIFYLYQIKEMRMSEITCALGMEYGEVRKLKNQANQNLGSYLLKEFKP